MQDVARAADPDTFEIGVKNRFTKIAEEMRRGSGETAYRPLKSPATTLAAYSTEGPMVAQGGSADPWVHADAVRAVVAAFGADVHDETCSSTTIRISAAVTCRMSRHTPAFYEGRLLGYACLRAHLARRRLGNARQLRRRHEITARGCGCRRCGGDQGR